MSQTITVSDIQSRVCTLCDLPATLTTDTTVTAAQMLDFLKVSCEMLSGLVGERAAEMYFVTSGTLSTVAATATVALPSGFSDLLKLTWQKSESEEVALERAQPEDMRAWPLSWGDSECTRVTYALRGSNLALYPTPDAIYTLNIDYSTGLYPTSTASTFVAKDNWQLWVTYQACLLVRARQQKDASDFRVMLYGPDMETGGLTASIRRQLKRDKVGVRRVRDVRGALWTSQRDPNPSD